MKLDPPIGYDAPQITVLHETQTTLGGFILPTVPRIQLFHHTGSLTREYVNTAY